MNKKAIMSNIKQVVYGLIFLLLFVQIYAQETSVKNLDRNKWKELKRDLNYNESNKPYNGTNNFEDADVSGYNKTDDNTKKKHSNQKKGFGKYSKHNHNDHTTKSKSQSTHNNNNNKGNKQPLNIPSWLSNLLLIVLGLILTSVLFWILLFNNKTANKKVNINYNNDEFEKSIEKSKSELDLLLENAIAKQDYRMAIRIYFIFIIKLLKEHQLIHWEKKKTNTAYLGEMQNNKYYPVFYNTVIIYEKIWYGKYPLNKDAFYKVEIIFKNFIDTINHLR